MQNADKRTATKNIPIDFFFCVYIFRNQAEVLHTCRGTISLHGALIHTVDSCTFVISNGGTQTFHIKGNFFNFIMHEK